MRNTRNTLLHLTAIALMLMAVPLPAAAQPEALSTIPSLDMLESGTVSAVFPGVLGDMVARLTPNVFPAVPARLDWSGHVIDSILVRSLKDTVLHILSFDATGLTMMDTTKLWKDGTWVNSTLDSIVYYKGRMKLRDYHRRWVGGDWVNVFRASFIYDASGKQIAYNYDFWDGQQWAYGSHYLVTYDLAGNVLSIVVERFVDFTWVSTWRLSGVYDAKGKQVQALLEMKLGDLWINLYRATFTFDGQGKQLGGLLEKWSGTAWSNSWRSSIGYNLLGLTATLVTEKWVTNQWTNVWRVNVGYDLLGNQLSVLGEKWLNGAWTDNWRFIFELDKAMRLMRETFSQWQGPGWVPADTYLLVADAGLDPQIYYGYSASCMFGTPGTVNDVRLPSEETSPAAYSLSQNYPNPFNPATTIRYSVPRQSHVTLEVFNTLGQSVVHLIDGDLEPGPHEIRFDARNLPSGVYFYRLRIGSVAQTMSMIVLR